MTGPTFAKNISIEEAKVYQMILLFGGIIFVAIGYVVYYQFPHLYCPPFLFIPIYGSWTVVGIWSFFSKKIKDNIRQFTQGAF